MLQHLEVPTSGINMDAALHPVIKVVYHEGSGLPIGCGDHVTIRYNGMWSHAESGAYGNVIQSVT